MFTSGYSRHHERLSFSARRGLVWFCIPDFRCRAPTSDWKALHQFSYQGRLEAVSNPACQLAHILQWTFLTLFAIFELGSLLCGVAKSFRMLIVGRAVAGMGASGILNGTLTIIAGCIPMPKRPGMLLSISVVAISADACRTSSDWICYR